MFFLLFDHHQAAVTSTSHIGKDSEGVNKQTQKQKNGHKPSLKRKRDAEQDGACVRSGREGVEKKRKALRRTDGAKGEEAQKTIGK